MQRCRHEQATAKRGRQCSEPAARYAIRDTRIPDVLARSGGGIARPGFDRLIGAICAGGVGAVLAIEASRLARNGRDWHMLIEFCRLVGTIIADENGIYDPRQPNDRLLLGMKGTMSELEVSLFRQRSQAALKQKAKRGALFLRVAAGYVKAGRDRIEKDPDQRVQGAIKLVFEKFAEFHSVRQVQIWLRDEGIKLPVKAHNAEAEGVAWRLPTYSIVHSFLSNPIYAGTHAFGRTTSKVTVDDGRKRGRRGVRRPLSECDVLITAHHDAYISWDEFERNQQVIADNAASKGSDVIDRGLPLLPQQDEWSQGRPTLTLGHFDRQLTRRRRRTRSAAAI